MTDFNPSFKFYYNNILYSKFRNSKTYCAILSEVNKLGLPYPKEINKQLSKENFKMKSLTSLCMLSCAVFLYKVKSITLINKITLAGFFYFGVYLYFTQNFQEKLLDLLLFSDTVLGQETRIVTKWFMPDHSKSIILDELISQFKEKVKNSKVEIEAKKKTIQNVIKKEGEEDESFILKLKEKLDKE